MYKLQDALSLTLITVEVYRILYIFSSETLILKKTDEEMVRKIPYQ